MIRWWVPALGLSLLLTACAPSGEGGDQAGQSAPTPIATPGQIPRTPLPQAKGRFDFYVLALSWSPSYCEAEGTGANPQQCGSGRPYAFVVHGLWPQFERGFPTDCKVGEERVPQELARSLYDIMPSLGLIGHQWRRHGSCSGFSQQDYFATLRAARQRVVIPERFRRLDQHLTVSAQEIERSFTEANANLSLKGVSVSCDKRLMREVRICMTRDLEFRECPELEKRGCRSDSLVMPPVRR